MIDRTQLQDMSADDLRALALELMTEVQAKQHIVDRTEAALRFSDAKLAQLTHEMAVLKRWKFAARSEKLGHEQQSLLDEAIDATWPPSNSSWRGCPPSQRPKTRRTNRAGHRFRRTFHV